MNSKFSIIGIAFVAVAVTGGSAMAASGGRSDGGGESSAHRTAGLVGMHMIGKTIDPKDPNAVQACSQDGGIVSRDASGHDVCTARLSGDYKRNLPGAKHREGGDASTSTCPAGQHTPADAEHRHGSTAIQTSSGCVANDNRPASESRLAK